MTDQLQPGDDLDARVAEAMGIAVVWSDGEPGERVPFRGPWRLEEFPGEPSREVADLLPEFSTGWAAMQEVIEFMRRAGWCVSIDDGGKPNRDWVCVFSCWEVAHRADAPTLPHAVALAMLEATTAEAKS